MNAVQPFPDIPDGGGDRGALPFLVASRLCHDLVGPPGAIANGFELLSMTGDGSPEMALIGDSVAEATARVRFFRLAYGQAAPDQRCSRSEAAGILRALSRMGRVAYDWRTEADLLRSELRIAFLLLQCLDTALPRGGRVAASQEGGAWTLRAEGPVVRAEGPGWDALAGRAAGPLGADSIQFLLVPGLLLALGRRLEVEAGPEAVTARF